MEVVKKTTCILNKKRRGNDMDSSINTDQCCVCLGLYLEDLDTDRQWLEYCCRRWIHEDSIDTGDVIIV